MVVVVVVVHLQVRVQEAPLRTRTGPMARGRRLVVVVGWVGGEAFAWGRVACGRRTYLPAWDGGAK